MDEQDAVATSKRHRLPPAIIAHAVWRYVRFAPRYRDVEGPRAARGVPVT
jgi:transposase-like protein